MDEDGLHPLRHETRLASLCAALNAAEVRYVLVGAQAGVLWGHARNTRDFDLLIEPSVENAHRVLAALETLGLVLARDYSPEDLVSRPITVLTDPFYRVDIMTVAWSVHYREARPTARVFEIEGVPIPTASLDHLIASKRTGRLQDAADVEVLEEIRRRGAQSGRSKVEG